MMEYEEEEDGLSPLSLMLLVPSMMMMGGGGGTGCGIWADTLAASLL